MTLYKGRAPLYESAGTVVRPTILNIIANTTEEMQLIVPAQMETRLPKQGSVTSRFLAKIALEALAERLKEDDGGLDYLIDHRQFDLIRNHARMGTTNEWPCYIRRIYPTDAQWQFNSSYDNPSQIIFECDFLFPNAETLELNGNNDIQTELYFIVALFGIEFAINIGGPEIEGYQQWLINHENISPLHFGKNQGSGKPV